MFKISFLYLISCVVFFVASCDNAPSKGQNSGTVPDSGFTSDGGSGIDPSFDCASIPKPPFTINELVGPIAYHDMAFTPDGYIIGASVKEEGLFKAKYNGKPKIFVPDFAGAEGMDFLPNGDLIVANAAKDQLVRITPSGEVSTLASGIHAYGLLVGPKGKVYATVGNAVIRIDPETEKKETLIKINDQMIPDVNYDAGINDGGPNDDFEEIDIDIEFRAINFNLDLSIMYIAAASKEGIIYAVDMDENLNPKSDPYVFVTGIRSSWDNTAWHDGLGIDICGNLYVPDFASFSLYRVTPDKKITLLIEWWMNPDDEENFSGYGHGVKWGLGVGNWKSDAIYLPQPYNASTVAEVLINVPARKWSWQE